MMKQRIVTIGAFCVIAIAALVRIGLAQEPIYLPLIVHDSGTQVEAKATPTATAEPTATASNYLGSYEIEDTGFGTEVSVVVDSDARTRSILSNAPTNLFLV